MQCVPKICSLKSSKYIMYIGNPIGYGYSGPLFPILKY